MSKIVFDKYDKDKSGTISKDELTNICYSLGHPLNDEQLTIALKLLDESGNGLIECKEFKEWWAKKDGRFDAFESEEETQWLTKYIGMFERFDKDKSGQISKDEFTELYKALQASGIKGLRAEEEAMRHIDMDRPGAVSLREFLNWLKEDAPVNAMKG